jgi:hypothetical protein
MITVRPTATLPADHLVVVPPARNALDTPWAGFLLRPPGSLPVRFSELPVARAVPSPGGAMSLRTPWQASDLSPRPADANPVDFPVDFMVGLAAPVAPAVLPLPRLAD